MITREFVTGGNATFTIQHPDGRHWTWNVKHKPATEQWPESYFVYLLTGPDNESDYTYVGRLNPHTFQVTTTAKSRHHDGRFHLKLLNRVLTRVYSGDHAAYEEHGFRCHHEGRCGRCGRKLTVPQSIETGFGPECAEVLGLVPAGFTLEDNGDGTAGPVPDYLP